MQTILFTFYWNFIKIYSVTKCTTKFIDATPPKLQIGGGATLKE